MTEQLVILGVDPGTCITGYGVIRYSALSQEALDFGCIVPPKKWALSQRYLVIFDALTQLIERHRPQAVAIETQFVAKNPQVAIKLGMARGMALLAATKKEVPVFGYSPRKIKQAVVGTGGASKQQVQKMMQILLSLPRLPEPEDAADALALAMCHGHASRIQQAERL